MVWAIWVFSTNEIRHVKILYNVTRHQRRVVFCRIAWVDQELPVNLYLRTAPLSEPMISHAPTALTDVEGSISGFKAQKKTSAVFKGHSQVVKRRPLHTVQIYK